MLSIQIINSNNPNGSAIDGEYSTATFKVIGTVEEPLPDDLKLTTESMQKILTEWNQDCVLQKLSPPANSRDFYFGEVLFIDDLAPKEGEIINLDKVLNTEIELADHEADSILERDIEQWGEQQEALGDHHEEHRRMLLSHYEQEYFTVTDTQNYFNDENTLPDKIKHFINLMDRLHHHENNIFSLLQRSYGDDYLVKKGIDSPSKLDETALIEIDHLVHEILTYRLLSSDNILERKKLLPVEHSYKITKFYDVSEVEIVSSYRSKFGDIRISSNRIALDELTLFVEEEHPNFKLAVKGKLFLDKYIYVIDEPTAYSIMNEIRECVIESVELKKAEQTSRAEQTNLVAPIPKTKVDLSVIFGNLLELSLYLSGIAFACSGTFYFVANLKILGTL